MADNVNLRLAFLGLTDGLHHLLLIHAWLHHHGLRLHGLIFIDTVVIFVISVILFIVKRL